MFFLCHKTGIKIAWIKPCYHIQNFSSAHLMCSRETLVNSLIMLYICLCMFVKCLCVLVSASMYVCLHAVIIYFCSLIVILLIPSITTHCFCALWRGDSNINKITWGNTTCFFGIQISFTG